MMANSYGIDVTNRFELFLDDESDPLEALKLKEQEKELKKKNKVAEKENKGKTEAPVKGKTAPTPKKVIKEAPVHKVQENKRDESKQINQRPSTEGKPERNYNKFSNENREERNNRRNREDKPYNGPSENNRDREDRPRRDNREGNNVDNFESRSRGGRTLNNRPGGPRGGPRTRNNFDERRGKREFDRQSGSDKTGVKPVDKRDGGGPHNWGSHRDVIEEVEKPNDIDPTWGEPEKTEAPAAIETKETENEAEPVPVEEEPKELTLDEWKAQRAGRAKPQYNIRKAGEGEDPTQWKKMYELSKKKAGEEEQDSEEEEFDASEYPQRVGRQKHILGIEIHFNDARRGGGGRGRGTRSGARGGRGGNREQRGERPGSRFRGNEEQVEERVDARGAPKVDDERDFPSLG